MLTGPKSLIPLSLETISEITTTTFEQVSDSKESRWNDGTSQGSSWDDRAAKMPPLPRRSESATLPIPPAGEDTTSAFAC